MTELEFLFVCWPDSTNVHMDYIEVEEAKKESRGEVNGEKVDEGRKETD